jgi:hypothetical protein
MGFEPRHRELPDHRDGVIDGESSPPPVSRGTAHPVSPRVEVLLDRHPQVRKRLPVPGHERLDASRPGFDAGGTARLEVPPGLHLLQEDWDDEIGRAVAPWLPDLQGAGGSGRHG